MAAAADASKMSFNPSWMGSTFCAGANNASGQPDLSTVLAPPILAKNKYGREEALALREAMGVEEPPDSLTTDFPLFYLAHPQEPICMMKFTEVEERLLHHVGINSSKAMSAVSHAERGPAPFQNHRWSQEDRGERPTRGHYGARGGGGTYGGRGAYHRGGQERGENEERRFGAVPSERGRGRGGTPHVIERSSAGGGLNPRAQGLYDPKDPRDRPRTRPRTTSTGESGGGGGSTPTAGGGDRYSGRRWKGDQELPEWAGSDEEMSPDPMTQDGTFDAQGKWMKSQQQQEMSSNEEKYVQVEKKSKPKQQQQQQSENETENNATTQRNSRDSGEKRKETAAQATDFLRNMVGLGMQDSNLQERVELQLASMRGHKPVVDPVEPQIKPVSDPKPMSMAKQQPTASQNNNNETKIMAAVFAKAKKLETQNEYTDYLQQTSANNKGVVSTSTANILGSLLGNIPPAAPSNPTVSHSLGPHWYYLDPKKDIQGPFINIQMQKWLQAGYFTPDLMLRNEKHPQFRTLASYLNERGQSIFMEATTPMTTPTKPAPVNQAQGQALAGLKSIWGDDILAGLTNKQPNNHNQERDRQESERRRILELEERVKREQEQRKLIEEEMRRKEELMRVQQQQLDIKHREQEELQRRAREELDRRESAERERLRQQQAEMQRQERLQEEIERKRKEAEQKMRIEVEHRQIEDRRKAMQADITKREEEQRRLQVQQERAAVLAAQQQQQEQRQQQQQQQQQQQHENNNNNSNNNEQQQHSGQRITLQDLFAAQSLQDNNHAFHNMSARRSEPRWGQTAEVERDTMARNVLSLQEIQQQEQRQMEAESRENDVRRINMQQTMNAAAASSVWGQSGGMKSMNWAPEDPRPAANPWGKPTHNKQTQQQPGFWDDPVPPAPTKKEEQRTKVKKGRNDAPSKVTNNNVTTKENQTVKRLFASAITDKHDELFDWVMKQVQQLSPDMDAPTFASFLIQVDSPDEVRDYIEGYFGDSRRAADFLGNFLEKRSQRKRVKNTSHRDDLAMPAPALMPEPKAEANDAPANKGRKKKGKFGRPVDSSVLSFTATGDPNRMNVGELDMVNH